MAVMTVRVDATTIIIMKTVADVATTTITTTKMDADVVIATTN